MSYQKALLILVGGRPMPNLLTVRSLRPDLLVPVVSSDEVGDGKWDSSLNAFRPFCGTIGEPIVVDAFDLKAVKNACLKAVSANPKADWTFNVTCGTKIMSFAACEVAIDAGIDCWYLNTNTKQVVALNGKPPTCDVFNVSLADYFGAYGRRIERSGSEAISPGLADFTRELSKSYVGTSRFQESFKSAKQTAGRITINGVDDEQLRLWRLACEAGIVRDLSASAANISFGIGCAGGERFINGGWLELFVWLAAMDEGCFDDLAYSFAAPIERGAQYEIDFAATFAGMLLVAECKTGKKSFEGKHIQKLNTVANHLGSNFVGKIFVTNQPVDESSQGMEGTLEQARQNHIVVVHGGNLNAFGSVLRREAGVSPSNDAKPTHFRG